MVQIGRGGVATLILTGALVINFLRRRRSRRFPQGGSTPFAAHVYQTTPLDNTANGFAAVGHSQTETKNATVVTQTTSQRAAPPRWVSVLLLVGLLLPLSTLLGLAGNLVLACAVLACGLWLTAGVQQPTVRFEPLAAHGHAVAAGSSVAPAGTGSVNHHPSSMTHQPNMSLNGVWLKNASRSDSMDPVCEAMRLNGIIRTAVKLIRGTELTLTATTFEIAMFSVVPWFKVRERYLLTGAVAMFKRRDLRRGKHRGHVRVEAHGGITVFVAWDPPLGGHGTDEFLQVGPDELHVTSTLNQDNGNVSRYNTVYERRR